VCVGACVCVCVCVCVCGYVFVCVCWEFDHVAVDMGLFEVETIGVLRRSL